MNILAIDNALALSGWAVYADDKLFKYGTFKTNSTDSLGARLNEIKRCIFDLLERYNIDWVYFEDCQNQSNRNLQTYSKLSMVKGIIFYTLYNAAMPCDCLSPATWRSILNKEFKIKFGRSRKDQKAAAKNFVKEYFDIEVSEDEADAICIGLAGIVKKKSEGSAF